MEPRSVDGSVETNGVEAFHVPADRGGTKLIVGNAPHEQKSGTPAAEAFVRGVLDGFAVGRAFDQKTDVPAPVGIVGVQRDVLTHDGEVGAAAARELKEPVAPPVL